MCVEELCCELSPPSAHQDDLASNSGSFLSRKLPSFEMHPIKQIRSQWGQVFLHTCSEAENAPPELGTDKGSLLKTTAAHDESMGSGQRTGGGTRQEAEIRHFAALHNIYLPEEW